MPPMPACDSTAYRPPKAAASFTEASMRENRPVRDPGQPISCDRAAGAPSTDRLARMREPPRTVFSYRTKARASKGDMRPRTLLRSTLLGAAALLLVGARSNPADRWVLSKTSAALDAFASVARPLSHTKALETAFRGYFAYKAEHPDKVTKPYLYFVDYGLPSTKPRGYVFDMESLKVVEGPFTVAHGRGSSDSRYGIPSRFSN